MRSPGFRELLSGPFVGLQIYPRVAAIAVRRPLLVWGAVLALCAMLVAVVRYAEVRSKLSEVADSELYLMPRMTVEGAELIVEGAPGRIFDAVHFVVLIDPLSEKPAFPKAAHGDKRPRVLVAADGLWVYSSTTPVPAMLPWAELSFAEGRLSLDGPELMDWLELMLRRVVVYGLLALSGVFFLYQVLLQAVFVGLYRTLFFRGPYLPGFRALFNCGSLAAIPVLVACTLGLLCGLDRFAVLGLHACLFGVLFVVAATRVRLADEEVPGEPVSDSREGLGGPDTPSREP